MRGRTAWGAYSYSVVGVLWAFAIGSALMFGFVSGLRHLLWMAAMPLHPMVPMWLWVAVALSGLALVVFGYRIVAAAVHHYEQRRRMFRIIMPHLEPFPGPVPAALEKAADWYVATNVDERYAFTWGVIRCRIAVSQGLWDALDESAQAAVMYHEAAHALVHDPFQQMCLQIVSEALRPLGLEALYRRYLVHREINADQVAVAAFQGDDTPLITALKAAVESAPRPVAHVGLAGALEARIEFLESQRPLPWSDSHLRLRLGASAAAVLWILGVGLSIWCHW